MLGQKRPEEAQNRLSAGENPDDRAASPAFLLRQQIFCAALACSRYRFVPFAAEQRRGTTLALLAESFAELDGVPAVVLGDRVACLKTGVVANVVMQHPEYMQSPRFTGFRPVFFKGGRPGVEGDGGELGWQSREMTALAHLSRT